MSNVNLCISITCPFIFVPLCFLKVLINHYFRVYSYFEVKYYSTVVPSKGLANSMFFRTFVASDSL